MQLEFIQLFKHLVERLDDLGKLCIFTHSLFFLPANDQSQQIDA
jgi:hypothetical protein